MPEPLGFVDPPHDATGDHVLRGLGGPVAKSALLLSVSTQPLVLRIAAGVFVSVGAGEASKQR